MVATAVPVQVGDAGAHELAMADRAVRLGLGAGRRAVAVPQCVPRWSAGQQSCLSAWSQIMQSVVIIPFQFGIPALDVLAAALA